VLLYCNFEITRPAKQSPVLHNQARDAVFKEFGYFKRQSGGNRASSCKARAVAGLDSTLCLQTEILA
jgi:hypothetical protein